MATFGHEIAFHEVHTPTLAVPLEAVVFVLARLGVMAALLRLRHAATMAQFRV